MHENTWQERVGTTGNKQAKEHRTGENNRVINDETLQKQDQNKNTFKYNGKHMEHWELYPAVLGSRIHALKL